MRKSLLTLIPLSIRKKTSDSLNLIGIFSLLLFMNIFSVSVTAQTPFVSKAVKFAESIPVKDMPALNTVNKQEDKEINEKNKKIIKVIEPNAKYTPDTVITSTVTSQNSPTPLALNSPTVNFEGISGNNCNCAPPDTDGEVGLNHYVQVVNTAFRIWDKAGNPLTPIINLSTLFAPLGYAGDGDPIVLYDQLADRWLISQFDVTADPNNHQLIAISKTGDPTGAYWLYDFMMPNNKFNDYPHFGVWPDAYYMSDNQFNQAGTAFQGAGAFAFDRIKMLAGDPTASFIYFDQFAACPSCGGQLPTDLDGFMPPPAGMGNLFVEFRATEFGDPADALRIFEFKPNFTTPAASTYLQVGAGDLALASFDARSPASRSAIEQPGTATGLDAIADRLMYRLAYRNLGTTATPTNSWVLNFSVNVGGLNPTSASTYQTGIRWTELRRAGAAGAMSVNQQGTLATNPGSPAGGTNLWMGSIAQNHQGDMVLGYSTSGSTNPADFPSIKYSGRLAADPAGIMAQGEAVGILGTGFQSGAGSRWGDYSAMSVDPANDYSFWYTQEYRTAANNANAFNWTTRVVGGITFSAGATTSPRGIITGTITNCVTGLPIENAVIKITGGYFRQTNAAGLFSSIVVPDTYTVTVTAPGGYNTVTQTGVVVTNGGTTTINLCLVPSPIMNAGSSSIVSESCTPANGVLDPNEAVTVSLCVLNVGGLNTTNLVGTLQATGGVTSPGVPQNFGVVTAGGAAVCRNFTFVANGTCGSTVTATLQLQDGATDLGTVTYNFIMGVLVSTNYSTNNIAVAVPDNVPAGVDIPITVSDVFTLADVNVKFRMNHTFDGDLNFRLIHPDGTTVPLVTRRGGSGDNFGTGANDCSGTQTEIDDQAATGIASGAAPFAGSFKPESPLSALNGKPSNGIWKLNVSDNAGLDLGTVGCFSLDLKKLVCATTCIAPPTVTIEQAVTQADPTTTSPINFTIVFNEVVTGFETGDVTLAGTAGATTAIVTGSGTTYNVSVSGMVANGTVIASIAPGVAVNGSSVGNTASTSTDNTVTYNAPGICVLTCPANITVSNTVNTCGAVVTFPATTGTGNCGIITTIPASGSVFPVGTTVVTSRSSILYDQSATPTGGSSSQNFETAFDAFDCQAADDFTVPAGQTWTITQVNVGGSPFSNPGPAASVNVTFYNNAGSLPGSVIQTFSNVTTFTNYPDFNITLPSSVVLAPGTYWVSIQANMDFSIGGQWFWTNFGASNIGNEFAWQNPGGGFGICTSWGAGSTGCGVTLLERNNIFTIVGSTTSGGNFCTFTVTVNDTQVPTITCPANITTNTDAGVCTASVVTPNPTTADNCAVTILTWTFTGATAGTSPATGINNLGTRTFNNGVTTVTYIVSDAAGNTATCSFTVTVNDNIRPTITCPANITTNTAPTGACSASVANPNPVTGDNCGVTLLTWVLTGATTGTSPATGINNVGTAVFNKGVTTVTYNVSDAAGNTATCSFTVTVNDVEKPVITCPASSTVTTPVGSCTIVVNYNVTATDNCPGVVVTRTAGLASGSAFPIGTNTVTHLATDASGNTSTCTFIVTVLDGQLPVLTLQPVNKTACATSNATFSVTATNAVTYQWQQWDGSAFADIAAGANASTYTVNSVTTSQNTNTYRVKVIGLCTTVTSTFATLYVNPLPTILLTTSQPPILLPTQTVSITATTNPSGGTYVWKKNGSTISGASGPVLGPLTVDDIGTYKLVYTDPNGCESTSADLAVIGESADGLWVYPNPNTGVFQVRFFNQANEKVTINVYNSIGQKIYQESVVTRATTYAQININLGTRQTPGVYIVEAVNSAGKKVGAKRIIVNR
jgi:subtilisin-like proprotein convertase family protein